MGVGIGGDYPLSAVISSEFASTKIRGRMMTAVFASQGWGNFCESIKLSASEQPSYHYITGASLVAFIITSAYKSSILSSPSVTDLPPVDTMWRLLIGLGAVPGVVALYFRLTIPETPRFTMDIERNIAQASNDIEAVLEGKNATVDGDALVERLDAPKASWADFRAYFGQWRNFKIIFGTSYSWFALDVRVIYHSTLSSRLTRPP